MPTETGRVDALAFFKKAVQLAHLVESGLFPAAILGNHVVDLLAQRLKVLRMLAKVVEAVRRRHGRGVDGSQAQEKLAVRQLVGLPVVLVRAVHHPLEEIVGLYIVRAPLGLLCAALAHHGTDDALRGPQVPGIAQ